MNSFQCLLRLRMLGIWGGCWLYAFVLLATPWLHGAAPFSLSNSEVRTLPRSANGRDYVLYVGLPDSYATSPARRYPVVYACDGYWDFALLTANVGNARVDGSMPEVILVGIAYGGVNPDVGSLRQWDLTPGVDFSSDPSGANSGHAQEFLSVIANQFIPFIESNYRADPAFRVLTGSSFGGLFTLYALFERPGLFQGYVAPSPSLWWRREYVLSRARDYAATGAALNARVFLTHATEEFVTIINTTRHFAQEVPKLNIPGLVIATREITGERHSSTKPESYNRGLRFVCVPVAPLPPTSPDPGFASSGTLINLSTRGQVGNGENVLIGGIVVQGIVPKRLLIRAAGPALGPQGVAAPVANPGFRVVDRASLTVAQNDDWGSAPDQPALARATSESGAFPFAAGSRDAAMIVSLEPGLYTIVVESVDGTTGVALVEAYELRP